MTIDGLSSARAGDALAFRQLTEPYRAELRVHCYRMLGSFETAEDVVQDTFLAAWQGLGDFEGRASMRTWLYKIATNRCLNTRRSRRRSARVVDLSAMRLPDATGTSEVTWIEPFPTALVEAADAAAGPDATYEKLESISLGFLTALQSLPRRSLAVLVLSDIVGFGAIEIAEMLGTTVDSVNSALKRARAKLEVRRREGAISDAASPSDDTLVRSFARAWESADVEAVVALLTDDVFIAMPPLPQTYEGRAVAARFCASIFETGRRFDLVPTSANGQPAFGVYLRDDGKGRGLYVLSLRAGRISAMTRFEAHVLEWFGLPSALERG